jgi:hypothetical protein
MKKLLAISLVLAVPGAYASDYDAKEKEASKKAFSSTQASHPTFARLGQMCYEGISEEQHWPEHMPCSKEFALDSLLLLDRACIALASGTPQEQLLAQSIDKTLEHGETAIKTLIALDKDVLLAKPEIRALKDRLAMVAKMSSKSTPTLSPEAIELIRKPLLEQIKFLETQVLDLKKLHEAERFEKLQLQAALIAVATGQKPAGASAGDKA